MGRDRDGSLQHEEEHGLDGKDAKILLKPEVREDSESESEREERKEKRRKSGKRRGGRSRKRSRSSSSEDGDSKSEYSGSESDYSDSDESESESETESDDEDERRRRKRKERKRREKEELEKKRRKKDKERKRKQKEKEREEERRRKKRKERKKQKKKEKLERGKKGAVTNSWGKYGIIRETDMWNKRPEFTAWLAEVKQINLESLPNWEEKQMFKQFMEDHNTATFPSKKYYDLDDYYRHKMEKEMKKGFKKALDTERVVFNDEEQRRQELLAQREKQKEQEVETLKTAMQSGMAQAMKEQAQLREEMAYQYKLGNFEAAAAIQRRLDPDVAM